MAVALESMQEAIEDVELNWGLAQAAGKFLIHISRLDSEGKVFHKTITWEFPRGDYPRVANSLQTFFREDSQVKPEPAPLPAADPKKLFEGLPLDPNGKDDE